MIKEIINKLDYDKLLTQSDPNINLVRDYLEHGNLYGYFVNNEPVSFIAVEIIDGNVEIKEYDKAKHIWLIDNNSEQEITQKAYNDLIEEIKK